MTAVARSVIDDANARIADIVGRYVQLKPAGPEFKACCPFHNERTPSFTVVPAKSMWHCFGCGKHGDAIGFVMEITGCDFREAVTAIVGNELTTTDVVTHKTPSVSHKPPAIWQHAGTPPDSAPAPDFTHYRLGNASDVYTYHDADGIAAGYVLRFPVPRDDGTTGKETLPYCWAVNTQTGEFGWRWLSFGIPRMLYGLSALAERPDAKVMLVEGEKAADAAARLFPAFVAVTWPGGCKAVKHADFAPLAGRHVTLWPDADHAGTDAMRAVWVAIRDIAASVRIVPPIPSAPAGWDVADDPPDGVDVMAYARASVTDAAAYFADSEPESEAAPAVITAEQSTDLAAVDWYSPLADVNGKGRPLATIENLAEICRRLSVTVRYNVISKEVELLVPGQGFTIDNQANASLAWLISCCARFSFPTDKVGDFLCYLADQNQHNPVANWITSTPWDGTPRLSAFVDTIRAEDEPSSAPLKRALLMRWMLSAVAAAFRPDGVAAAGVLVLQGDQYLGKTKWFKSLVPPEIGVIQDGLMLRPDDRDSVKQAVSYWLVELGELDATFRKSDIAQLKAFLTRDRDVLRRAYARLESKYARRTVFFASVNPRQFLHDPTGNRRYWTISCTHIDHTHGLDMQQVWAEVYESLYLKGESIYLTPDEMGALNTHNQDYEVLDPVTERLQSRYDWASDPLYWRWVTATDVLAEIGFDRPSKADVTACGMTVLRINGKQTKRTTKARYLLMPHRTDHHG